MYSEGPCEQKPIKNFGENGAWAYTGTAQMFWVPPIISGTDKATNFKFCTLILSIDQNNNPLKISGAVAGCEVRTLKTFKCTHILGASRGLLCDSYAVLFLLDPILHHSPNLVVYWVEIWAIQRQQIRWDECGCLPLQQLYLSVTRRYTTICEH